MVNSMLSYLGLSEGFWGDAMLTACYLLNRVPNKRNKNTPYELWYYVIEPNDFVSINSIIESRDAIFNENHFSSIHRLKDIIQNLVESQRDDHSDDVPSKIPEPRKGKRDPRTYNEAMHSRDAAFWKEAIDDEIGPIMENNTWVLSDLPQGCKPSGCKWIFKRKMKVDGTIDKFKARLVLMDYGLSYVGYPSVLEGYSDASWINHVEDSSSTSGWVFLLGGGAISWASKKQTCITGSTMEYEFVALACCHRGKEQSGSKKLDS
ncbi:zinc finger, CCHC-type containing protein [Tanacetum coccineum]|uniref:Zinc finger, CCHC-type containing protein n=1 Tax=Tanacetum coccineum TaxID=301880 RepID=A0ABQ4Y9A8_9ASTR